MDFSRKEIEEIMGKQKPPGAFFAAVYDGDVAGASLFLDGGLAVDTKHASTGMSALHIAVGRNNLAMTRFLIERGATFFPDAQGRLPSTIAGLCEVGEDLCDYIADAEARAAV
ncbi:MAG: ankyrin repeat domain-containing protein [Candidatus Gracilibacteria bacterium]|jgi:ankyrin repeat protein